MTSFKLTFLQVVIIFPSLNIGHHRRLPKRWLDGTPTGAHVSPGKNTYHIISYSSFVVWQKTRWPRKGTKHQQARDGIRQRKVGSTQSRTFYYWKYASWFEREVLAGMHAPAFRFLYLSTTSLPCPSTAIITGGFVGSQDSSNDISNSK